VRTIHSSSVSEPAGEGRSSLINIFGKSTAWERKGNKENKKRIKIAQDFFIF